MSPRRRSPAVPLGTPARHVRGARRRRRPSGTAVPRVGGLTAAGVVVLGLAGGMGAGAAVQALDGAGPQAGARSGAVVAGADAGGAASPDRTAPSSRSARRSALAGLVPGMDRDEAPGGGRPAAAAGAATAPRDATEVSSAVEPAGGPLDGITVAARGVPGDVRPMPLPTLLPPGTVGPVWLSDVDRADGLLSVEVPESGTGALDVVLGSEPAPGTAPVRTVRVEVEQGLPVDGPAFAAMVMTTLNDPRGWGARGGMSFARTDGPADLRVVLASPSTVDVLCAPLRTDGQVSCGRNGHAVLNLRRWVHATDEFADRHLYRQYLVNHEVGHLLGHPHEDCPGDGQVAPVMQQQSYAVAPCTPNGWPFP